MPFFHPNVRSLEGHQLVGNGDCAQLIKLLTPGLTGRPASMWKQGARVLDTTALLPGTAIATFVNGKYPDNESGQHAAFFLSYAGKAIWVMDQWKNDKKKLGVSSRLIHPGPPRGGRLSNNAEAFYVIELR